MDYEFGDIVEEKQSGKSYVVLRKKETLLSSTYVVSDEYGNFNFFKEIQLKPVDTKFTRRCEKAEQQLTGFWSAWGKEIFDEEFGTAAASIGLTAEEWGYIKNHIGVEYLTDGQIEAIEKYLAEKEDERI